MKIYAVADIHGKPEYIQQIHDMISQKRPDILIIAGDITHYFDSRKAIKQLKDIKIPVFAIRGNWDFKVVENVIRRQANMQLLTPTPVNHETLNLVGFNGTFFLPFLSKICIMEKRLINFAAPLITKDTIVVAHPPPRGILDQVAGKYSAGSFGLKKLIQTHSPLMVLCGHIHEQSGYQFYKNTLVVNCAMNKTCGGAIIEYDKIAAGKKPRVSMITH